MEQGLLWIKGKPGAGKSTLMAFIYNDFKTTLLRGRQVVLDFFFHGRGTTLQKTPIGMFRSLLHQLYIHTPVARERMQLAFRDKNCIGEAGKAWEWQLEELRNIFFNIAIDVAKSHKIYIFVDALDEAGAEVANDLADYFHRLNDFSSDAKGAMKVCISCRHFPIVGRTTSLEICVEENNLEDIITYVRSEISSKLQIEDASEADLWQDLEDDIVNKASGVFQWVRLVVPLIIKYNREGESLTYICQKIMKVPKGLGDVYEHILKNVIEGRQWARTLHLMQWVCLAKRPLSVTELRYALNSDTHSTQESNESTRESITNDTLMEKLIRTLSGGLAETNLQKKRVVVQFIHQSVNDFLLSGGLKFLLSASQDNRQRAALSIEDIVGQSHDRLSRSCVNYIALEDVQHTAHDEVLHKLNTTGHLLKDRILHDLPFIDYAAKSWFLHAEKAENLGILQQDLIRRFESSPQPAIETWVKMFRLIDHESENCPASGSTLLHVASKSNLRATVRLILDEGRQVDERDDAGNTALHHAARYGHMEMVNILIDRGADIKAKTKSQNTTLELAVVNEHEEVVKLLLSRSLNVNEMTGASGNALQGAAYKGSQKLVKVLIDNGAEVNAQGGKYGNALQAASRNGFEAVVRLLLEHNAEVNAQGGFYGNALQAASSMGFLAVVWLLLEQGAEVNAQGGYYGNALEAASGAGSEAVVRLLLERGARVNAVGGFLGTALQAAAAIGFEAVARLLVAQGADVNALGGKYSTALQAASKSGSEDIARLLLEHGAEINAQGGKFGNALQAAAAMGAEGVVRLLLDQGAEINAQDGAGTTALLAALWGAHFRVVRVLVEFGADVGMLNEHDAELLQKILAKSVPIR